MTGDPEPAGPATPPNEGWNTIAGGPLAGLGPTSGDGPLSPLWPSWPAVATRCHCAGDVRRQRGDGHGLRPQEKCRWDRSRWSVGSNRPPGGHRARHGCRSDHLSRCRRRCTGRATPVHQWMRTSPSFFMRLVPRRRPGPPEGRLHPRMQLCGHDPTTPRRTEGDVAQAARTGSMPAWSPPPHTGPT